MPATDDQVLAVALLVLTEAERLAAAGEGVTATCHLCAQPKSRCFEGCWEYGTNTDRQDPQTMVLCLG